MRGVILAGGSGSRLLPLTKITNKHLLPVGQKPMIYHPLEKLIDAGIRDIMVVTGVEHVGAIVGCLGSGKDFGCSLTYRVQDTAGGIAQALNLTRGFCYGEKICVLLGDNIFEDDLTAHIGKYAQQERGAMVLVKEVDDPERYGVAELEELKVISIEEKPAHPKSNYAVTGVYFYDYRVFDIIAQLKPSDRGELEITDVNNKYLEWGELRCAFMRGWWTDAGEHASLVKANTLV